MLGGGNSSGGIQNDNNNLHQVLLKIFHKYQMIWMMKFPFDFMEKLKFKDKNIKLISMHDEMSSSYLSYAMSVIVSRALQT